MAKSKPLTLARLEQKLRHLLLTPEVTIRIKPLHDASAQAEWEEPHTNILITVDPDREGRIRCVIHELLHVLLSDPMRILFDNLLEEVVILALENAIVDYTKSNTRRLTSWRRAIEAKLTR